MKLIKEDLVNCIFFEENKVNLLIIENKKYFTEFISEIIKQSEGEEGSFLLFKGNKEIKIENNIEVIHDIFCVDLNNKKIINKIYLDLEKIIQDSELLIKFKEIECSIFENIYKLIEKYEYLIEFEEKIIWKDIFKLLSLKLSKNFENKLEEEK